MQNDSVPVDYLGLALTDEGRSRALSYDESQKSMIERQCQGWGASYAVLGPFGLRISRHFDTFDDIGVPEPYFPSWGESEKLFGRIFTEVVLFNINFTGERELAMHRLLRFGVVISLQHF